MTALDINFENAEKIAKATTVLEIHISKPGFRKAINTRHFMDVLNSLSEDDIANLSPEMKKTIDEFRAGSLTAPVLDGKPDPTMFHVSQDLIDSKAIRAINREHSRINSWIKHKAVPSPIKLQGAYLMRLDQVDLISDEIEKFIERRIQLVNNFGDHWEKAIADAKVKRGPFFDASDYPAFNTIKASYDCEYRWVTYDVPAALEAKNKEIYAREAQKAKAFFVDAAQEARDASRIAFTELTNHLLDQLGNDAAGKPKRFMGKSLDKIVEFVEMFIGGGDLTNDEDLQKVALKAKEILSGVSGKDVRKNEGLRSSMQTAMNAIKEETAKLVTVSTRKFAVDAYDYEESDSSLVEGTSLGLE